MRARAGLDVVGGEVEVGGEGLLPGDRTGPVLTQQGALVRALAGVAAFLAKVLFFVFLVLFMASLLYTGLRRV